jgi:crossover junction endodeoxyribonuclease RuvC
MTVILGVDPGLTRCGIGVIDKDARRQCTLVHVSVATTNAGEDLVDRIGILGQALEAAIDEYKPNLIAIERVFAQANLRSVMGVAQISGVLLMLASRKSIPVVFHTPSEVKSAVTGNGRAEKAQVGNMVAKILGLAQVPKPADAADALAIAITAAWKNFDSVTEQNELTPAQKAWRAAQGVARGGKPPKK